MPSTVPMPGPTSGSDAEAFLAVVGKRQGPLKGECTSPGHEDDIAVIAWEWGMSGAAAQGSTRAAGRRVFEALRVDKSIDASSTKLLSAMSNNEELRSVTLSLRKAGVERDDFFTIALERARVRNIKLASSPSGGLYETVQFAFQKITVTYHPQQDSGRRGAGMVFDDELRDAEA